MREYSRTTLTLHDYSRNFKSDDKEGEDAFQSARRRCQFHHLRRTQKCTKAEGFTHDRTTDSHEIWIHPDIDQSINIQPRPKDKTMAKPYQVREFRKLI